MSSIPTDATEAAALSGRPGAGRTWGRILVRWGGNGERQFLQRHVGPDTAQPLSPGACPREGTTRVHAEPGCDGRSSFMCNSPKRSQPRVPQGKAEPGWEPHPRTALARSAAGGGGMRSLKEPTQRNVGPRMERAQEDRAAGGWCDIGWWGRGAGLHVWSQTATHTQFPGLDVAPQSLRCPSEGAGEGYGASPGNLR